MNKKPNGSVERADEERLKPCRTRWCRGRGFPTPAAIQRDLDVVAAGDSAGRITWVDRDSHSLRWRTQNRPGLAAVGGRGGKVGSKCSQ